MLFVGLLAGVWCKTNKWLIDVNTQYGHTEAGNSLGVYNGNAIVIGGRDYLSSSSSFYHNEVEVLEFEIGRLKWNLKDKYPYHSR